MPTESQKQVLDHLVAERRLTEAEASRILKAPRVVVTLRTVLSSLAVVIISIGLVRLGVALLDEASEVVVVVLLYGVASGAGAMAWRWRRRRGWRAPAGEFAELLGLGAAIGATAVIMTKNDIDGHWLAMAFGGVSFAWGGFRIRSSVFSGVMALVPGTLALAGGVTAWWNLEEGWSAVPFVVMGVVLTLWGQTDLATAVLLRLAGVLMIVSAFPSWLSAENGVWGVLPVIGLGVGLIATGNSWSRLEQVVGGSILVVAGVTTYAFGHIENEILQGLVVVAVGSAGLGMVLWALRHRTEVRGKPLAELG